MSANHVNANSEPKLLSPITQIISQDNPFGKSFKQLLKDDGLSLDLDIPNKFETLLANNKYSNYYFNFSTDFPDNYKMDRGVGPYSILRAIQPDSAITLALLVVPVDMSKSKRIELHESFQAGPLESFTTLPKGMSYEDVVLKQFQTSTNIKPYNSKMYEKKIRNNNYVFHTYNYDEVVDDLIITFTSYSYLTQNWGNTYSFSLAGPSVFVNKDILDKVVFRTNYIYPAN